MNRRRILLASAAGVLEPFLSSAVLSSSTPRRMGITTASYWKRWKGTYSNFRYPPFQDVLDFMDHVRSLGIGSVQVPVEGWSRDLARRVRATCESYDIEAEGSIRLPHAEGDQPRFEHELRTAREAGITTLRTALGGRRYENFTRLEDFTTWQLGALRTIELAAPILSRLRSFRIGIENHKDLECHQLLAALRHVSSPHLGACIDTGNSLALLEDPLQIAQDLAPYAVTVHLKDMAVQETPGGFLLAEVPLGQGILDLPAIVNTLLAAHADLRFQLEMITRNPLSIPCLRPEYWTTFPNKSGVDLARIITRVRTAKAAPPATNIDSLPTEAALELEEKNILLSLTYAATALGFRPLPKTHKGPDESHDR